MTQSMLHGSPAFSFSNQVLRLVQRQMAMTIHFILLWLGMKGELRSTSQPLLSMHMFNQQPITNLYILSFTLESGFRVHIFNAPDIVSTLQTSQLDFLLSTQSGLTTRT